MEATTQAQDQSSSTKRGPKPKADANLVNQLEERIDVLEQIVSKMAHYSGNNRIIVEMGLKPWEPSRKDMRKYETK